MITDVEIFFDVSIRKKNGMLVSFSKNHKTIKDAEDWAKKNSVECGSYEIVCVERKLFLKRRF